ncbi:MAG: CDGSH iron-sulfur domain-containing protein [Pseudomonadota bacterium]|nr:MAG: CDGSH iron-sulfur domain-containing protein [Pseudomonadota bacterium]
MGDKEKAAFSGKLVDVEWDGRLCIHIAECGRAKGELFVGGRKPWGQPDLVSLEEVLDVVARCPSGALTYEVKAQDISEQPDKENTVTVTYNGPYFVRGDLEIENSPDDMPGVAMRAALCRCGQSKNKPFCDNSHEDAGFRDYGAVGEKGDGIASSGGTLAIKQLPDGPLLLSGNITIKNGCGRVAWSGTQVALCRCGASNNKPFCDGSHTAAGFKSQ